MVSRKAKGKGRCKIVAEFIKSLLYSSSPFSISPTTDYQKHVPKSASELSEENWNKVGNSLRRAIKKVGEEIGEE